MSYPSFRDCTSGLIDDQRVLAAFSDALVEGIAYNGQREVVLSLSSSHFIPCEEVRRAREAVGRALRLNKVELCLRYPASAFTKETAADLLHEIRLDKPVINGFLDGADIALDEQAFHVTLHKGGLDILQACGCTEELEGMLRERFGLSLHVEWTVSGGEIAPPPPAGGRASRS